MKRAIIFDYVGTLTTKADEQTHILRPEAEEILNFLDLRFRLAVISKASDPDARIKELMNSPLPRYCDHLQACREKTEGVVQKALRALKVSGNECYAIDDRVKNFPVFNQLGCETIWLKDGAYASELPQYPGEAPCRTITSLSELVSLLV